MTAQHDLLMVDFLDENGERRFQCHCECGWTSRPATTNACMGDGRRHVTAKRRAVKP